MTEEDRKILNLAMAREMITFQQASLIRDEIGMFPGMKAANLLVQRGYLSVENLALIRTDERKESSDEPQPAGSSAMPAFPDGAQATPSPVSAQGTPTPVQKPLAAPPAANTPQPRIQSLPTRPPTGSDNTTPLPRHVSTARQNSMTPVPTGPVRLVHAETRTTVLVEDAESAREPFLQLLRQARETNGSVLHLRPLQPPFIRHFGEITHLNSVPLTPSQTEKLIFSTLTQEQQQRLIQDWQLDFSFEAEGLGRHSCTVSRQQLGWEGAFKIIPREVPTIDSLGLPAVHKSLMDFRQGLIVVTGPTGAGKTTTIAAMIEFLNQHRDQHIITIENPLEYVFSSKAAHITQREIGSHTKDYGMALRGALRQDPDVMMIGDLRDLETTSMAISAAETGHLVLATLHTNSAMRTVARILDVYPPNQREQICVMLSESLRGIITQQLVPRKDGKGLALAQEILVITSGAAQLIRESKTHMIISIMQGGKRLGMQTMDDSLMDLVQKDMISGEQAYARADNKALFEIYRSRS